MLHEAHLLGWGDGPSVIFESGLGGTLDTWRTLQMRLANTAQTLAYNRAGIGFSQASTQPRDATSIAYELRALQDGTRMRTPSVLVCHSIGAIYCLVFAATYPERVAGLVLVDPHHPDTILKLSTPIAQNARDIFQSAPMLAQVKSVFGIARLRKRLGRTDGVGDTQFWYSHSVEASATHWQNVSKEGRLALGITLEEGRAAISQLPAVPLIVLSASLPLHEDRNTIIALHRRLSGALPLGRHQVVQGVDHSSILTSSEGSDEVHRAIREILNRRPSSAH